MDEQKILLGKTQGGESLFLLAKMANRHGLISGATGTGKTVTLQTLAESFSLLGVPVFSADVKGDLAGIARPGGGNTRIEERRQLLGLAEVPYSGAPTVLWALRGGGGHPVRTTFSEMGPLLLGRLLELSDAQADVLRLVFKVADSRGWLLLDMKDLLAVLEWMEENESGLRGELGGFTRQTAGALRRRLLVLGEQGGGDFFGEPALDVRELMRHDLSGRGLVHVLDARDLMLNPHHYATFMLWLMGELFEKLDEVGDPDKPRLVFFFDEAHLLFRDAPPALVRQIEQVVRLIRSKGVGIYFVTQSPADLPESVLGQLGNRVQHALRAFSAKDQKAIRAAAETFPLNPGLDIERAILELAVGEALVSCLDEKGKPQPTQRAWIAPPVSRLGPLSEVERKEQISRSPYGARYDAIVDRESAYEMLKKMAGQSAQETSPPPLPGQAGRGDPFPSRQPTGLPSATTRRPAGRRSDSFAEAMGKSVIRTIGAGLGREILRGILGGIKGRRR